MRYVITFSLCGLMSFGTAAIVTGCQTSQPGVKSSYVSQWTTVAGSTTEVTEAAKDTLEDLDLKEIKSSATEFDGLAIGYTADDTRIVVNVERITDATSKVSVQVGAGDPDLGNDIIARIRKKLA